MEFRAHLAQSASFYRWGNSHTEQERLWRCHKQNIDIPLGCRRLICPGHLVRTPSFYSYDSWGDWADLRETSGSKLTGPHGVQPMAGEANTKIQTRGWNVSKHYPSTLWCQSRCVLVMQLRLCIRRVVISRLWNQTDLAQNSSRSLLIIIGIKTTSILMWIKECLLTILYFLETMLLCDLRVASLWILKE